MHLRTMTGFTSILGCLLWGALPAQAGEKPQVKIEIKGEYRVITGNGLPNHATGKFPNRGNPNSISAQHQVYQVPLKPQVADEPVELVRQPFGIALNGVLFDPATAEWWNDDPSSGWHEEAIVPGQRPGLGIDPQLAHVQPNGAYHYHGLPPALMGNKQPPSKMVLLGWAADGYPIYGNYAHKDANDAKSPLKKMTPSYALKKGARPAGSPGGQYNGRYTQDYEVVQGKGDLDACNGRTGVTPEFPQGTYYYVVTETFPYIPRAFHGQADDSFKRRGDGHGGQRRGRPGGSRHRPPQDGNGPPDGAGPPDGEGPADGPPPRRQGPR